MAHLVRQQFTKHVDAAGRKVPAGTPGARKVVGRAAKYYGVGIPGYPPKKRVPLASDKLAARRMLDQMVRDAERGRTDLPDRGAARMSVADLIAEFEKDVALGLATRKKSRRVPTPAQVGLIVQRVRDTAEGCGFRTPADLNDAAPAKLAAYLQARVGRPRKDGGLSHQSATFYLSAAGRFAWWLASRRLPVRPDLFDAVPGFDPETNRVHARRELAPDELARVLGAALGSDRPFRRLTGADRYHLYLVAFSTGYRAGELAILAPSNFEFDGDRATIRLSGRRTKNRKKANIPLNKIVAVQVRTYLSGKPAGVPIWPGGWHQHAAEMLRGDLAAAGVPYCVETPDGPAFADFHAMRHSFVSALAAAGVGPKELQTLARHSDPRLTLGLYTHARDDLLTGAVDRLTVPGSPADAGMTREQLEALLTVALAVAGLAFAPSGVSPGVSPDR